MACSFLCYIYVVYVKRRGFGCSINGESGTTGTTYEGATPIAVSMRTNLQTTENNSEILVVREQQYEGRGGVS